MPKRLKVSAGLPRKEYQIFLLILKSYSRLQDNKPISENQNIKSCIVYVHNFLFAISTFDTKQIELNKKNHMFNKFRLNR